MWFNLDLCGITMKMRINGYHPSTKDRWDEEWCKVDFSFISEGWLNYQRVTDEVLLSSEIEELAQSLDDLLTDKLSEEKVIECIEPDFKFVLVPKRDLRNDPQIAYVQKGYEIADIYMDMKIYFWHEGLTDNYLSVSFGRSDIECFRDYLLFVMRKIDTTNPRIIEMMKNEILIGGGSDGCR